MTKPHTPPAAPTAPARSWWAAAAAALAPAWASPAPAASVSGGGLTLTRHWAVVVDTQAGDRVGDPATRAPNSVAAESALFSPDGRFVAAVTKGDDSVQVLDARTGATLWKSFSPGAVEVEAVAWSADGRWVFSGSQEKLRVWDAATGALLRTLEDVGAGYESLELSPGGRRLAGGNADGEVRVYDVSGASPAAFSLTRTIESSAGADGRADVNQIDWAANGDLFSANRDRLVRRIDPASDADAVAHPVAAYAGVDTSVKAVRLSPDQALVAAGGGVANGEDFVGVALWCVETTQLLRVLTPGSGLDPGLDRVEAVEFTPDGRYLLVGGTAPFRDRAVDLRVFRVADLLDASEASVRPVLVAGERLAWRTEFFSFAPGDADGGAFELVTAHDDGSVRRFTLTVPPEDPEDPEGPEGPEDPRSPKGQRDPGGGG